MSSYDWEERKASAPVVCGACYYYYYVNVMFVHSYSEDSHVRAC